MRAQHEAGRALREQAMALFTQPTVDANAVEALRQKQMAVHDEASKRMTQAMLEISRVLTPEQRKQIAEQMTQRREMMQRHQRERQARRAEELSARRHECRPAARRPSGSGAQWPRTPLADP